MSNPAPTLNQINAFNATQGTTIDFNIIGGTEVIRSNKIYIYDLSDNSLICTHLYVSTESIHELPPNTSSSIVYASGKSSADFTNNTQYYAQIQTFTDVGGTQGGSGLSIAKLFWCLPTPTLTLSTIPTTISTTSYNVSATYTPNTSGGATNEIQEFQFNLYSAIGALLQTSGVVLYGEGVDLSYNFSGLEVDSTYYVTLDVTTTQGMNVSAQSSTFTVSIDTPTLGEATVVNNACDGYISVTSNLSEEYGGSASGEIASFVTDSVNNISSLKVNLDPVQDLHGYDKPWVGGAGKNLLDDSGIELTANALSVARNSGYGLPFTMKANATYTVSCNDNTMASGVYLYTPYTSTIITAKYNATSLTYTSTEDTNVAVVFYWANGRPSGATHIQIELGSTATTFAPWENLCPITGWTGCEVDVSGVNQLHFESKSYTVNGVTFTQTEDNSVVVNGTATGAIIYNVKPYTNGNSEIDHVLLSELFGIKPNTNYILSGCPSGGSSATYRLQMLVFGSGIEPYDTGNGSSSFSFSETDITSKKYRLCIRIASGTVCNNLVFKPMIRLATESDATFEPYNPNSAVYPVSWQSEAGTVYGGTVDLVTGVLTVTHGFKTFNGSESGWNTYGSGATFWILVDGKKTGWQTSFCNAFNNLNYAWALPDYGVYCDYTTDNRCYFRKPNEEVASLADWKTWLANNPVQICYELATPTTYQLDPVQVQTLLGQNNVWSNAGNVEITYNIPITNLLVKRQDVADVSGAWLTLYSQPITQASDMDFTFIDFLNQYGKTYKYALVPLLNQTQSGVVVQIEGGYTVSDNVDSIFDGVYIADQTNVERVKAGVGYGNIDMNQGVGSITPIGSKYPIVITNSQNQYHNGSVRGTIVPNDFYSNGNLSRIDMVNKRDELEQFLTNKRAKIIKDWNGNIWLVMIMSNVNCSFDDNYGMGMVSFSADWLEVGDPTNQQDLYNAGLINVGGV